MSGAVLASNPWAAIPAVRIDRKETRPMPASPIPVPPTDLSICFGGGDYARSARMLLDFFIRHAGLQPDERVLDVGCGAGRAAWGLAEYLSGAGSYRGFDTFPAGVDWCRENLSPRLPNFEFRSVDVFSGVYNPCSNESAESLRFPYADNSFDLVVLVSVFTHMLPADVANYIAEIARVLAPGGRVFATWYLMNDAARGLLATHASNPDFTRRYGGFWVADPHSLEDAVAYEEHLVRAMLEHVGLQPAKLVPGRWCGRENAENGQDMLVAVKA
jgi:SAM-dependent methyltransferase